MLLSKGFAKDRHDAHWSLPKYYSISVKNSTAVRIFFSLFYPLLCHAFERDQSIDIKHKSWLIFPRGYRPGTGT